MKSQDITILAIESSCDDTSAAVIKNGIVLSNVIANQDVHKHYGGVVPELASRAHQQNIVPVVARAIHLAEVDRREFSAVAFTRGPGLVGSLLVGTSFAKAFALANSIPLIEVNHLQGHVLSLFIREKSQTDSEVRHPKFPFLCLLVSGGNSQIIKVSSYYDMEILGQTIDDAAGEAFDKCAKLLGLPYPGGPHVDRLAKEGNPQRFTFNMPRIPDLNYSFSGMKTSFLYFIKDQLLTNPNFMQENLADLCSSLQFTIVEILMTKLRKASKETGIKEIAISGGVAANSGLRNAITAEGANNQWNCYIPPIRYTMDNAGMIATAAHFKYLNQDFVGQDIAPLARMGF